MMNPTQLKSVKHHTAEREPVLFFFLRSDLFVSTVHPSLYVNPYLASLCKDLYHDPTLTTRMLLNNNKKMPFAWHSFVTVNKLLVQTSHLLHLLMHLLNLRPLFLVAAHPSCFVLVHLCRQWRSDDAGGDVSVFSGEKPHELWSYTSITSAEIWFKAYEKNQRFRILLHHMLHLKDF